MRLSLVIVALWLGLSGCCPCADGLPGGDPDASATVEPETREDGSVVLSRPGGNLHTLARDREALYWARGHRRQARLMTVPKAGGPTRTLLEPGDNIERIIPDGQRLFVATWGGIWEVPIDGGQPRKVLEGRHEVHAMTLDGDHLYFCADEGGIYRVPREGGEPTRLVEADRKYSTNLGVHKGHLYWINNRTKAIERVPVGGGQGEVIARDLFPAQDHDFLFDEDHLYFYRDITSGFGRVPLGGGEVEMIEARPTGHFRGFAIDEEHLYWGRGWRTIGAGQERRDSRGRTTRTSGRDEGQGGVMRVRLTGGGSENLSSLTGKVEGVAVDREAVYWLDADEGIIVRLDKKLRRRARRK